MSEHEPLIQAARDARELAHAPFSKFKVGAVVMTADGQTFSGNNIESTSFGLTMCAERVAIFKAISEGATDIISLTIVADTEKPVAPCGACRQIIADFADSADIILANMNGESTVTNINHLLPGFFRKSDFHTDD